MPRAKMPTTPAQRSALVLELGDRTLTVDVESFTIPEQALMQGVIARLTDDARAVTGAAIKATPDMFASAAAFVVARRAEPTLTYDAWMGAYTVAQIADAVRTAQPAPDDSPEG